jgi:hypothetical protein
VEARAARLGLGRVSVVRGEGRLAGTPCIDDTIRSLEPVADHLTRYSGLVRAKRSLSCACLCKRSVSWRIAASGEQCCKYAVPKAMLNRHW